MHGEYEKFETIDILSFIFYYYTSIDGKRKFRSTLLAGDKSN